MNESDPRSNFPYILNRLLIFSVIFTFGASGASSIGDHFLYSRDLYNYLLLLFIIYNYFKGDIERRN